MIYMENKDKINFDLNFLDKNIKEKPQQKQSTSGGPNWGYPNDGHNVEGSRATTSPGGLSDAAKKWAWGIGIVVVISTISSFSGNSSSTPTPSTVQSATDSSGQVQVGHYMCSSYAASYAGSIQPNSTTLTELNAESDRIDAMGIARKSVKADLDSTYVDQTDQYAIDSYNERVNTYNASYQTYSNAYDSYEAKKTAYNNQVDTYNNYLENNCTPN